MVQNTTLRPALKEDPKTYLNLESPRPLNPNTFNPKPWPYPRLPFMHAVVQRMPWMRWYLDEV